MIRPEHEIFITLHQTGIYVTWCQCGRSWPGADKADSTRLVEIHVQREQLKVTSIGEPFKGKISEALGVCYSKGHRCTRLTPQGQRDGMECAQMLVTCPNMKGDVTEAVSDGSYLRLPTKEERAAVADKWNELPDGYLYAEPYPGGSCSVNPLYVLPDTEVRMTFAQYQELLDGCSE